MTVISRDYHDYVFRDGKLLGDFEGMYQHSEETPWRQDETAYDISADIDIAILRRRYYRSICDVGAGLGYVTARLYRELSTASGERPNVTGIEISRTAVRLARERFPEITFLCQDMLRSHWAAPIERYNLVVAKDVLWYVCQELDEFLDRLTLLSDRSAEGGWILVSQSFPASETWVGQEIVGGHVELIAHLSRFMDICYSSFEREAAWKGGTASHILGRAR